MVSEDYREKLKQYRGKIDSINDGLLRLLEKRAELVEEIGRLKAENGKKIYDPVREQEIYDDLCSKTSLPEWYVRAVFKVIIDSAKKLEAKQTVKW